MSKRPRQTQKYECELVHSLYVVGAKLGVVYLLPPVGQLWGRRRKDGLKANEYHITHHKGNAAIEWLAHSVLTHTPSPFAIVKKPLHETAGGG